MATQQDRIAQFRKMASDDPDNELGHYSLGRALMDAEQYEEAAAAFERTLALNPQFSKAYQLLGTCYLKRGQREQALTVLREGHAVADERGDNMPRDEMAQLIRELGEQPPASRVAAAGAATAGGGFACQRPGCHAGIHAQQLPQPPMRDELGRMIYERICADCWREWLGLGVKVINEMRLDLSDERAQEVYESYMKEFFGFE